MKFTTALALSALITLPLAVQAQTPMSTPAQTLHALFDSEWECNLRDSPESASYQGDTRFDDRWTDMSLPAIAAREAAERNALARLRAVPRAQLSAADQLHYDTFEWQLQLAVDRQRFQEWLQPIGHQGGVQTADGAWASVNRNPWPANRSTFGVCTFVAP